MFDELRIASEALSTALDSYLGVCTSIRQHCYQGIGHVPDEAASLIANELLSITSYKTKIQQANASISLARNFIPKVVPINTLPQEILSCLFLLITYEKSCRFHNTHRNPIYPIRLTRVCSRWRQVAINTPALWSHIDVSSYGFRDLGQHHEYHLAHPRAYLARAGGAQLDVHIFEKFPYGLSMDDRSLVNFVAPLANRIRSLEIYVQLDDNRHANPDIIIDDFCDKILSACLVNCTPGGLKHLVIARRKGGDTAFFQPQETPDGTVGGVEPLIPTIKLDISEQRLEDLLATITHLKINGRYPTWSSKAYQGLTELRLYSNGWIVNIPDFQFTTMLAASPHLHTLEFGLTIRASASRPPPVLLSSLRNLIVDTKSPNTFLPLIALGTQAITVSLLNPQGFMAQNSILTDHPEIGLFVSRWNVTTFCAREFIFLTEILRLVDLMSSVKTLVLSTSYLTAGENLDGNLGELDSQPPLKNLCLAAGLTVKMDYQALAFIIKRYRIKGLLLTEEYSIAGIGDSRLITRNELRDKLTSLGVAVGFYSPLYDHLLEHMGHDFATYGPSEL